MLPALLARPVALEVFVCAFKAAQRRRSLPLIYQDFLVRLFFFQNSFFILMYWIFAVGRTTSGGGLFSSGICREEFVGRFFYHRDGIFKGEHYMYVCACVCVRGARFATQCRFSV